MYIDDLPSSGRYYLRELENEGYLVDICIIYAMISFLAVIVLTKVYMGVYQEKKEEEDDGGH